MLKLIRVFLFIGGLSLLMLVALLAILRPDETTESNMIAFVSNRNSGDYELFTMLADGSRLRRVFDAGRLLSAGS